MPSLKNKKILVLAGGISPEREVSLKSGQNCYQALIDGDYKFVKFYDLQDFYQFVEYISQNKPDLVLLCTHGSYGEDGRLQSILDWLNIPYTGSKVLASALAFNKYQTKQILQAHKLPIANGALINSNNIQDITYPCVLKAIESGSSIGVYLINKEHKLLDIINNPANINTQYLWEQYYTGREITVSILNINNKLTVLPILEICPKNKFYDLDAKYTEGQTDFILPAQLDIELENHIKSTALKAFRALDCQGYGRVDIIITPEHKDNYFIMEINTLPGMTNTSDLPQQAQAYGLTYIELLEYMLLSAVI